MDLVSYVESIVRKYGDKVREFKDDPKGVDKLIDKVMLSDMFGGNPIIKPGGAQLSSHATSSDEIKKLMRKHGVGVLEGTLDNSKVNTFFRDGQKIRIAVPALKDQHWTEKKISPYSIGEDKRGYVVASPIKEIGVFSTRKKAENKVKLLPTTGY